MPIDENLLARVLADFGNRLTAIEGALSHASRSNPSEPTQPAVPALSPIAGGGQSPPSRLDSANEQAPDVSQPEPDWSALPDRFSPSDPEGTIGIPLDPYSGLRPRTSSLPRPRVAEAGIGTGQIAAASQSRQGVDFAVEGRAYPQGPAPDNRVAQAGSQFLRAVDDEFVQVRAEDGRLLGAIPKFGADVEQIHTQQGQQLNVGMVAVRAVVIPYNQSIDPYDIQGFIPAPGIQRGALTTGMIGQGRNLDNPDIGRRV